MPHGTEILCTWYGFFKGTPSWHPSFVLSCGRRMHSRYHVFGIMDSKGTSCGCLIVEIVLFNSLRAISKDCASELNAVFVFAGTHAAQDAIPKAIHIIRSIIRVLKNNLILIMTFIGSLRMKRACILSCPYILQKQLLSGLPVHRSTYWWSRAVWFVYWASIF